MRLDKFLAHNGYGSRNDAKKIIKAKLVSINGEIVSKSTYKVNVDSDIVTVDNEEIHYFEKVYYMLNKPAGYISSHYSNLYPSVIELIDTVRDDLIMVGRLDVDTEGLLLITNDGKFSHNVIHGKKDVYKTYYVELRDIYDEAYTSDLEAGILMDEEILKPAFIEIISDKSLYLSIAEGKYHQVKRMMNYANNEVTYLKRIKIGNLDLDESLALGEYRDLTEAEIEELLSK